MTAATQYQWQPTTAEIARRFGLDVVDVIRFDQNTSPHHPDWAREVAAEAAGTLNEYPDATYRPVREAAARYAGVTAQQVAIGAGVDELILLAAQAFLDPGSRSVMLEPTYSLYRIASQRRGAEITPVVLAAPDFGVDAGELLEAAGTAAVMWLCVPNNPTGTRLDDGLIAAAIEANPGITILDAAYAEIAGDSWGSWLERHPRLIVMHTLSKGFGLAGARVGFALAGPDLVGAIDAIRPPGSVSSVSSDVAIVALGSPDRMVESVRLLRDERTRLGTALEAIGLAPLPSEANFLLAHIGVDAAATAARLMAEGIVVRTFANRSPLAEYIRFTVRSPEEDDRLIDALRRTLR